MLALWSKSLCTAAASSCSSVRAIVRPVSSGPCYPGSKKLCIGIAGFLQRSASRGVRVMTDSWGIMSCTAADQDEMPAPGNFSDAEVRGAGPSRPPRDSLASHGRNLKRTETTALMPSNPMDTHHNHSISHDEVSGAEPAHSSVLGTRKTDMIAGNT